MEGGGLQDFFRRQGDNNNDDDVGLGGNVIGPKIAVGGAALIQELEMHHWQQPLL